MAPPQTHLFLFLISSWDVFVSNGAELGIINVTFENQSGAMVELYWDDGDEGQLMATLEHNEKKSLNSYLGHKWDFKSANDEKKLLYSVYIEEYSSLITLNDAETMQHRDAEHEREKALFMKEYYEKTGRFWRNFYPKEPVIHHYHSVNETGDTLIIETDRSQFKICSESDLSADDFAKLAALKNEQIECSENENEIAPFYAIENANFYIVESNQSIYCRQKNERKNIQIVNICNHGPFAFRIYDFLSDDEMQHIINLGQQIGLEKSGVRLTSSEEDETGVMHESRTSSHTWISRDESVIVDNVIRRIADVLQIDESLLFMNGSSEMLQVVHYFGGEQYTPHYDYVPTEPHSRYITFIMYLNDVEQGGYTSFPLANERCKDENDYFGVKPLKGSVMFFYNLFPDGNVDEMTEHFGEPPVECEKWMTNLWIWDKVLLQN